MPLLDRASGEKHEARKIFRHSSEADELRSLSQTNASNSHPVTQIVLDTLSFVPKLHCETLWATHKSVDS